MNVSGVSSSMASVLMGLRSAQAQTVEAVERITNPYQGLGDTVELSSAVLDLQAAQTQTKAMALVAKAQQKNLGSLLDVLG